MAWLATKGRAHESNYSCALFHFQAMQLTSALPHGSGFQHSIGLASRAHLNYRRLGDLLRVRPPLLLSVVQGWHRDIRPLRVGVMHRLTVMPKAPAARNRSWSRPAQDHVAAKKWRAPQAAGRATAPPACCLTHRPTRRNAPTSLAPLVTFLVGLPQRRDLRQTSEPWTNPNRAGRQSWS